MIRIYDHHDGGMAVGGQSRLVAENLHLDPQAGGMGRRTTAGPGMGFETPKPTAVTFYKAVPPNPSQTV